jgi:hypothetical protein
MRTIKNGAAARRGIRFSPNVTTIALNARQSADLISFTNPPDHDLDRSSAKDWSVVVTDPSVVRKDERLLDLGSEGLDEHYK